MNEWSAAPERSGDLPLGPPKLPSGVIEQITQIAPMSMLTNPACPCRRLPQDSPQRVNLCVYSLGGRRLLLEAPFGRASRRLQFFLQCLEGKHEQHQRTRRGPGPGSGVHLLQPFDKLPGLFLQGRRRRKLRIQIEESLLNQLACFTRLDFQILCDQKDMG